MCLAFAVAVVLAAAAPAFAAQRHFVASYGNDANPCSLTLPCRQFAAAAAVVDPGGEIVVLDSAGYGSVVITKSVAIIAPPGVYAGITIGPFGTGVSVNAGAASTVVLRGLTINGPGPVGGVYGIFVTTVGTLHIEDCTFSNVGVGIAISRGDAIHVARTVVRSSGAGVGVISEQAAQVISVTDSTFAQNTDAGMFVTLNVAGSIDVFLTRVTATSNAAFGFRAWATDALRNIQMTITDSVAARNGGGFEVDGISVTGNVSGSALVRNTTADLSQKNNSILRTAGDNATTGGVNDVSGTLSPIGLR
jgi:hypothetical protein